MYLAGTMTGWRCVKMSRPEGEAAWVHIHDTLEGTHHYKFLVDGLWCVEEAEPTIEAEDKVWNVMEVKKTDFEVFEALACDSFSLKMSEKNKLENKFNSDSWCQVDNEYHCIYHLTIATLHRSVPALRSWTRGCGPRPACPRTCYRSAETRNNEPSRRFHSARRRPLLRH